MASNTTGAPTTQETTITGTLNFDTASATECANMKTPNGTAAMKEVIQSASGVSDVANVGVTITCSTPRRLSDGRRLTGSKAKVDYTVKIPVGSSATAATTAKNKLAQMTPTLWTNSIKSKMANKGITVTPSGLTATAPTSFNQQRKFCS